MFKLYTKPVACMKNKNNRGVFAFKDILKGEIVDMCPVVLVKKNELLNSSLHEYFFHWDSVNDCIVLGYGSLINHSNESNVTFYPDYANRFYVFVATRDIKKDEQILMDYLSDPLLNGSYILPFDPEEL